LFFLLLLALLRGSDELASLLACAAEGGSPRSRGWQLWRRRDASAAAARVCGGGACSPCHFLGT
jgi:hypothetical protein